MSVNTGKALVATSENLFRSEPTVIIICEITLICGLFYHSVSSSDYVVSNYMILNEDPVETNASVVVYSELFLF